jgi:hypothetical protein
MAMRRVRRGRSRRSSAALEPLAHPEYGVCRGFNHEWSVRDLDVELRQHGSLGLVLTVTQTCGTCGTNRTRYLDPASGVRLGSGMEYAEGYVRKGEGRMTADEQGMLRLDWVRTANPAITRRLRRIK